MPGESIDIDFEFRPGISLVTGVEAREEVTWKVQGLNLSSPPSGRTDGKHHMDASCAFRTTIGGDIPKTLA